VVAEMGFAVLAAVDLGAVQIHIVCETHFVCFSTFARFSRVLCRLKAVVDCSAFCPRRGCLELALKETYAG
jgi:hypothetical protein